MEDPTKNYIARQAISENGTAVTMMKYRADGLTLEQWEQWRQDPTAIACAVNDKVTREILPDDEGHRVIHIKLKMPLVISNRSMITCFYETEKEDGTKVIFHSSRGNEDIVAANAAKIKKDVVANNEITYMSWKPYDGGIELNQLT